MLEPADFHTKYFSTRVRFQVAGKNTKYFTEYQKRPEIVRMPRLTYSTSKYPCKAIWSQRRSSNFYHYCFASWNSFLSPYKTPVKTCLSWAASCGGVLIFCFSPTNFLINIVEWVSRGVKKSNQYWVRKEKKCYSYAPMWSQCWSDRLECTHMIVFNIQELVRGKSHKNL